MTNSIIEFLNLKEEEIEDLSCTSTQTEMLVHLSLKLRLQTCPTCGQQTSKVLNKYLRKINHGLFINRKCTILYTQKRYRCSICQTSFNESCSLVSKGMKKSISSHLMIMDLMKDAHVTFKFAGELLNLSAMTVIDTFIQNAPHYPRTLPRYLCIDEVYLGRKAVKKYISVLLDFETSKVFDIIYGRTKKDLHSYFQRFAPEERHRVEMISCDMYEGFRVLKSTYFKKAIVCIDSFHVIKLINSMFDDEMKRVMKCYEKGTDQYYLLKDQRYLLLSNQVKVKWDKREYNHHFKYTISNYKLKELLLEIDPIIKRLYDLKEKYLWINSRRDVTSVEKNLNDFITECFNFNHKEVKRVGKTLLKWKAEILNSFTWIGGRRISNGPIESRNNTIKLLLRNAAGYRNFDHLRLRILYVINSSKKDNT